MTGKRKRKRGSFGAHLKSLRTVRGLTQDVLAELCELSPETIRRLEYNDFSPSLDTLKSLARGLQIQLSTLFEGYEVGVRNPARELVDLITGRSDDDIQFVTKVVRTLICELDARGGS